MKRTNELIVGLACVAVLAAVTWVLLAVGDNMRPGVTPFSQEVYQLHMFVLIIVSIIGISVFAAMFTSIILHRKSRGAEAAQFSHSTKAEVVWTIIPIVILVVMAVPATRVLIMMEDTGGAELNVKVTGYQWLWRYEYLEDEIDFYSAMDRDSNYARQRGSSLAPQDVDNYLLEVDKRLILPTDTRIRFLLTADDVIHSWWVPDLGWKRDAIPGMVNEAWTLIEEPGIYRGQCAELCGKDHGFMPVVVEAVSPEEYRAWVDSMKAEQVASVDQVERLWTRDELMQHGEAIYNAQCATCHQADGTGLEPAFPALALNEMVNGDLEQHIDLVLNGRPGTAMAGFGQRLEPQDIAATLTYTRNSFGNETGDMIQPAQISHLQQELEVADADEDISLAAGAPAAP
ncbi:MAG: cytochrome c oxidase subunit II [Pseudomonadota bacterium]